MTALPEVLEKLEPCPFCSGEAIDRPVSPQFWTVSCTQCQTEGPPFPSQSEALTAWNTRPALLRDAGDGWRSIESAPRDGSYILVCNSHGSWIAKYHPVYPSGYRPSNPWASMMLNHDHIERPGRFDHPTHWRPLSQPPAMHAPGGADQLNEK